MRGSWVGTLCSCCHCPLESGGTLPLQGVAARPPWLTPRMAEVVTAHLLLLDNSRETSTEKRKKREEKEGAHHRKTSPTPLPRELERDARGLEQQSGLLALWPLGQWHRFVSAQTQKLSLSFLNLFVATHCARNLGWPRRPNTIPHATIPATTEACIIASAGLDTLSPAPANCVLLLLSLVLLPVRSCPSARAEEFTRLRLCSWRQGGVSLFVRSRKADTQKARSSTGKFFAHASIVFLDITSIIWNTLA